MALTKIKSTAKLPQNQLQKLQDKIIADKKEQLFRSKTKQNNENIRYDSTKQLTNITEGEKYLIIHRVEDTKTMRDFSPILLETAIRNATQNGKPECKFLKSGDLLIKTENLKQAQNLIRITGILDATIQVTEHKTLNSCRGVIRAYELQNEDSETLLNYLQPQQVTDVRMHTKQINGHPVNTGLVFVTFGVNLLPEYLTVGLLRIRVRPYIPSPMRCYACHKFGHLSKHCNKKDNPTCYNCNNAKHIHNKEDKCTDAAFCVNCNQLGHNSYNRNCTEYKRQIDIQTIKVTQNVSMAEAVKRSNLKRATYAEITSAQSDTICKCQHCNFHNKKETANITNKRIRPLKENSQELTTDEETTKRIRTNITDIEMEEDAIQDIT
ncbi:uncharacterized protein [Chironomus tepperi]|uniref:uncharacterized protein n=1 Tax=Chironomus tepperi TaxID=113505 RepID=UPI00391FBFBA